MKSIHDKLKYQKKQMTQKYEQFAVYKDIQVLIDVHELPRERVRLKVLLRPPKLPKKLLTKSYWLNIPLKVLT